MPAALGYNAKTCLTGAFRHQLMPYFPMNNALLPRLALLLCACALPLAHAETADRDKPLNVEADAMQYDDANKVTVFTGRVVGTKGTIVLRAGKVVIKQDAAGNYNTTATAEGGPQAYMRQKREGLNEFIEGQANTIVRDDRTQMITLTGNARMRRLVGTAPTDEVLGDTIVYNDMTETYNVHGGASTAGTTASGGVPAGRVRATLSPSSTNRAASAPAAGKRAGTTLRPSTTIGGKQ